MHFGCRGVSLCLQQIVNGWWQSSAASHLNTIFFPVAVASAYLSHSFSASPPLSSLSLPISYRRGGQRFMWASHSVSQWEMGCSVLWVTESSCVADPVFVCVSRREHVQECLCVCSELCAVLLCRLVCFEVFVCLFWWGPSPFNVQPYHIHLAEDMLHDSRKQSNCTATEE